MDQIIVALITAAAALITAAGGVIAAALPVWPQLCQVSRRVVQVEEGIRDLEDVIPSEDPTDEVSRLTQEVEQLREDVTRLMGQNEVISQRLQTLQVECRRPPPETPSPQPLPQPAAQPRATQPPAAPTNLQARPRHRHVDLTWDRSPGAATYNVYRVAGPGGRRPALVQDGLTAAVFTHPGLDNGVPYCYQVTAVNAAGESPPSNVDSATPVHPILTWAWERYVSELRQLDQDWQGVRPSFGCDHQASYLQSRLNMLRLVTPLAQQRIETLDVPELKALFGLEDPACRCPSAGWCGDLGRAIIARPLLTRTNPAARQVQAQFTAALQSLVCDLSEPALQAIGTAFAALYAIHGINRGVITRYFTLRCPNVCVSVNKGSLGLEQVLAPRLDTAQRYQQGLRMLWIAPWMQPQTPPPRDQLEADIYKYRAALLDCFVYDPGNRLGLGGRWT